MKLYRINKLKRVGGPVIKSKDILARDAADAVSTAENSEDCPICDVLEAGKKVGAVT
ncbi:hypothetical protein G7078_05610 [Sphingomonas sinipercae]|uniref:Uncharacterized protein n=1 Tax=Sphingomonas sinipercae TaxID=2714944 RepID=A0A6G7ZN41_9SPHN|nr:hypothetical protein [Sphingomonas sinipercae]QIL02316.1 hypothetical protein G7078_05610 [Sphingomonas sinipercae]